MFVTLILLVLLVAVDLFLLFWRVRPRSLVMGQGAMALLIAGACAFRSNFDLGPHIEVPGWTAGLIIAGLWVFAALIAIIAWDIIADAGKK